MRRSLAYSDGEINNDGVCIPATDGEIDNDGDWIPAANRDPTWRGRSLKGANIR